MPDDALASSLEDFVAGKVQKIRASPASRLRDSKRGGTVGPSRGRDAGASDDFADAALRLGPRDMAVVAGLLTSTHGPIQPLARF